MPPTQPAPDANMLEQPNVLKPGSKFFNNFTVVVPTGFDPVFQSRPCFCHILQIVESYGPLNTRGDLNMR